LPIRDSTDRVFLTGAAGFVGSHILRALRDAGYGVVALRRSTGSAAIENGVTYVEGDLRSVGGFAHALDGCRFVVHAAALYSFVPSQRRELRAVNVIGTASLCEAAHLAGVERLILTSSSATLGTASDGRPRTEEDWAAGGSSHGYHHSKLEQERAAFAGRVPVIALLPTAPVGPGDWKPTPTGKMILDFARGKMFAKPPPGGMNLVPVEDVARAHVVAIERGHPGERYILGGRNLPLDGIWELLAEITGKPLPSWRAPYALALAAAYADELRCRLRDAEPRIPIEGVRMSRTRMFADSSKAERELGWRAGDVRHALQRAVAWYRENGYV
jgi:dihydroflavonol-4-reductase